MFHYPIEDWDRVRHGALHLHGHTHGNLANRPGRWDVGVDRWDMQPVTLTQIKARITPSPITAPEPAPAS
jgi:calcineurin-like phosphoesterase family protein